MTKDALAEKYTKALMRLEGRKHDSLQAFEMLLEIFKKVPFFKALLASPMISKKEKKELFDLAFRSSLNPRLLNFLFLLVDKNVISFLPEIAAHYKKMALAEENALEVTVDTPFHLEEKYQMMLKNYLETILKQSVLLKEQINPKMIGGVLLSFDNKIFNCSIRGRLFKLTTNVMEAL